MVNDLLNSKESKTYSDMCCHRAYLLFRLSKSNESTTSSTATRIHLSNANLLRIRIYLNVRILFILCYHLLSSLLAFVSFPCRNPNGNRRTNKQKENQRINNISPLRHEREHRVAFFFHLTDAFRCRNVHESERKKLHLH